MSEGGDIYVTGLCARQAMERLMRDGLPPSPDNYAVYYHYFAGDMAALNVAFDVHAAAGKLTQEQCTKLYDTYFLVDAQAAFLKDANSIIEKELGKLTTLIDETVKGNTQFGERLDSFSGKLVNANSLETLREAVKKISDETRAVSAHNHKLQNELAEATAQLSEVRQDFDRVRKESQVDPLTEVGNRKFFDREIARATQEAQAGNTILSLLMVDIDHFKNFNDTHGHLIGDHVLRLVARTLVENLKGRDVVARYGGEEFVILLPQTRVQDAERVANQIRSNLATQQVRRRGTKEVLGSVTISIGAAEYCPGEDSESFISRADKALYRAKDMGRNCVVSIALTDAQIAEIKKNATTLERPVGQGA